MQKLELLQPNDVAQCANIVNLNYNGKFRSTIAKRLQEMFSNAAYSRSKPTFVTIKWGKTVVAFGGFAESQFNTGSYEIFLINTHPNFQGNGFATLVVNNILEILHARIITSPHPEEERWLLLNCRRELVDFYRKFGFCATISRKDGEQYLMIMNTKYLERNLHQIIENAKVVDTNKLINQLRTYEKDRSKKPEINCA